MSDIKILTRVSAESRIPPENRIFVNRNLRMGSVEAIGFDLDHTLAHYRGPAVEEIAFQLTRERLVERFGYPEELLAVPYDRNFVIRGLVIDKRRGNILKMDYYNYVARGYHGFRRVGADERKTAYRSGRVRMSSDAYVSVDTLFHLPEVFLYVVLVDLVEKGKVGKHRRPFTKIYEEVRESIDSVHRDGTLKREILGNMEKYIRKDPRMRLALEELRGGGKKLFLLTNSEYYYSGALLNYLLANGEQSGTVDWREFFDVIVVDAGKPSFFIDLAREAAPARPEELPSPCPIFHGGNARQLEDALGFSGDQILYFGDHTYGDILRSKKNLGWRTAMVVEELKEEMDTARKMQPQLDELNHWKALRGVLESDISSLEMEVRRLKRKLEAGEGDEAVAAKLVKKLEGIQTRLAEREAELKEVKRVTSDLGELINKSYNPNWGPLFREGQETSRFGHQVKDFACLYMTRVSNLLYYNLDHYYRSAVERMPHEL
jgi:HAD superfamily 5'-nucleotidase-like hydrolase